MSSETIRDRFAAVAPHPPPPCPRCGGKSVRLTYGFPVESHDWYNYAGPKLFQCLGERTEHRGCILSPEQFRCTQCGQSWPTEFPEEF